MLCAIAGGGAAGIAAALTSAKAGIDTLLIEADGGVGGDLFSGMPLLGTYTSRGEQCVYGILDELRDECRKIDPDAWLGPVCDYRTVHGLCVDPEILRLAVYALLHRYGVRLLLNSMIVDAEVCNGRLRSLNVKSKNTLHRIACDCAVDATGGGYLSSLCGAGVFFGSEQGEFQPVSLVYRMCGVDYEKFLAYIRDNPEEAILCENPVLPADPGEAAGLLYRNGLPYVAVSTQSRLLGEAVKTGRLHPCTAAFITPTSRQRREVCLNVTRIAGLDCADDAAMSDTLPRLAVQVADSSRLFKELLPGFADASISSVMFKMGVRESGRIDGEYTLTQDDVLNAGRFDDVVAHGCHHVDIHGSGNAQIRIPIRNGSAYDIPYRSLLPKGLANVIAAGRCIASDRGANGTVRVMGTCLDTGQAAGRAAAVLLRRNHVDFRQVKTEELT